MHNKFNCFLIGLLVACGMATIQIANAQNTSTLSGIVTHIRDGDTIKVGPVPIRLEGVSAPEIREHLGRESKKFMSNLVYGKQVTCNLIGPKTYDRFVGVCFLNGEDIGALLIKNGLARECKRYSRGRYRNLDTTSARSSIKLPKYCLARRSQ